MPARGKEDRLVSAGNAHAWQALQTTTAPLIAMHEIIATRRQQIQRVFPAA